MRTEWIQDDSKNLIFVDAKKLKVINFIYFKEYNCKKSWIIKNNIN